MKRPEHPRIRPLTVKTVLASQRTRTAAASAEATDGAMTSSATGGKVLDGERGVGAVFTTPDQLVHACLALMEANGLDRIAVLDDGKLLGLLGIAELQQALIAHYESIFTAIELDQKILFLQGTYSC